MTPKFTLRDLKGRDPLKFGVVEDVTDPEDDDESFLAGLFRTRTGDFGLSFSADGILNLGLTDRRPPDLLRVLLRLFSEVFLGSADSLIAVPRLNDEFV